jgi:hypothetical protein
MIDDPVVILSGSDRKPNSLVVKRRISLLRRDSIIRKFPISERNSYSNNPREIPQYIGFSWTLANSISFAESFLSFSNHPIPNPAADQRGDWLRMFQKDWSTITWSERAS